MTFILQLPVLVFAIVLHEYAHGFVALMKGDPTARDAGRLTLNPLPHLDPIGSVLVPLILIVSQGFAPRFLIGWARPVPINPALLRRGVRDLLPVALAGPLSNVLLAIASTVLLGIFYRIGLVRHLEPVLLMLQYGVVINCVLAGFNLLPVPPLDGSNVLLHLLPPRARVRYAALRPYALPVLVLAMVAGAGPLLLAPARWSALALLRLAAWIAG